ncbi:MAG TPA: nucleotidyltransferase family protein, partial [Anaerolineae bacterium]
RGTDSMKHQVLAGGSWPTPQQQTLLRAALLRGDDALCAWEDWKANSNIDNVDRGSFRLLPLLYHNLASLQNADALMPKLKGIYRQTWYKNQLLFREIAQVLNAFQLAGIETLVLKGAALNVLYYKDVGLRPMQDFDLLIRLKDKDKALQLMSTLRWELNVKAPHGWSFKNGAGYEVDLHWHALAQCCKEHDDDDFWTGSVPAQVAGVPTRALNPTDQLLHVCVHGVTWNEVPPVRWIADASMILRADPIDWSRLIAQAQKRELILTLRESLNYLRKLVDAPVPAPILQALDALSVSRSEQWDYAAKICRPEEWTPFYAFWTYYREYLRSVEGKNIFHKVFGFPGFLQYLWKLNHLWQVPIYALMGAVKRTWRTVRTSI